MSSPGRPLHLALRQQIEAGWHTYWLNPGEFRAADHNRLDPAAGFQGGADHVARAQRFASDRSSTMAIRRKFSSRSTSMCPTKLAPGTNIRLSAHASWLVCSDTCIPEDAEVRSPSRLPRCASPIRIGPSVCGRPRALPRCRIRFPRRLRDGDSIKLHVASGDAERLRDVAFFPADRDVIDDDAPQTRGRGRRWTDADAAARLGKPPPAALNGLFVFRDGAQGGGNAGAIMISTPFNSAAASSAGSVPRPALRWRSPAGSSSISCRAYCRSCRSRPSAWSSTPGRRRAWCGSGRGLYGRRAGELRGDRAALIGLRAAGAEIGWGFQLQSPLFVGAMIYVLFAVGLNLSGVFTSASALPAAGEAPSREVYADRSSPVRWRRSWQPPAPRPSWRRRWAMRSRSPGTGRSRNSKRSDWGWRCPMWRLHSARACALSAEARIVDAAPEAASGLSGLWHRRVAVLRAGPGGRRACRDGRIGGAGADRFRGLALRGFATERTALAAIRPCHLGPVRDRRPRASSSRGHRSSAARRGHRGERASAGSPSAPARSTSCRLTDGRSLSTSPPIGASPASSTSAARSWMAPSSRRSRATR